MGANEPDAAGTPRWVKVSGIIALVAVVLVVVMLATGRGDHGPGRHTPSGGNTPTGESGGHTGPPSGVTHP